jgi:hypothetical protein
MKMMNKMLGEPYLFLIENYNMIFLYYISYLGEWKEWKEWKQKTKLPQLI